MRLSPVDMNNIRLANSSPCLVTVNLAPGGCRTALITMTDKTNVTYVAQIS